MQLRVRHLTDLCGKPGVLQHRSELFNRSVVQPVSCCRAVSGRMGVYYKPTVVSSTATQTAARGKTPVGVVLLRVTKNRHAIPGATTLGQRNRLQGVAVAAAKNFLQTV